MNDSELESLLRSSRVPERPNEYWDDFAARVTSQALRPRRHDDPQTKEPWLAALAWGSALVTAWVVLGFAIGRSDPEAGAGLSHCWQTVRAEMGAASTNVFALMENDQGLPRLLNDSP